MRFKLSETNNKCNIVYLTRDFLHFKKGDVIWANHAASDKKAFYKKAMTNIFTTSIRKTPNKQHLDSFFRAAIPLAGTYWKHICGQKLKITKCAAGSADLAWGSFAGCAFDEDKRIPIKWSPAGFRDILHRLKCYTLIGSRVDSGSEQG